MREIRKSGSAGARGRQRPWATQSRGSAIDARWVASESDSDGAWLEHCGIAHRPELLLLSEVPCVSPSTPKLITLSSRSARPVCVRRSRPRNGRCGHRVLRLEVALVCQLREAVARIREALAREARGGGSLIVPLWIRCRGARASTAAFRARRRCSGGRAPPICRQHRRNARWRAAAATKSRRRLAPSKGAGRGGASLSAARFADWVGP
jgi:hypothetical protein